MDLCCDICMDLKQKFIEAEYNYMLHLKEHMLPKFNEQTEGFVWDTTHYYYNIMTKTKKNTGKIYELDTKCCLEIKKKYRKLSKLLHPDLCVYDDSNELFAVINELYYEGDIDSLMEIESFIDNNDDKNNIKNYILNINKKHIKTDKEILINEWKNSLWFNWFKPDSIIKQIYVEPKIYHERLLEENKKLKDRSDSLNKLLDSYGDMFNKNTV